MYAPYRKYIVELAVTLLLYTTTVFISLSLLKLHPHGLLRIPIVLLPVIPSCCVPIVVIRLLRRVDEFHRKFHIEALAFAFTGTAILSFTYGWLQVAGFPQVSWLYVWPLMGVMWIVGGMWSAQRYR